MEAGTFLLCPFHKKPSPTAHTHEDAGPERKWFVECYACQARGPRKRSEQEAMAAWLDIQMRLLIPAKEMVSGRHYKLRTGEIVEFSRVGATGRYIVHPPGEPDMQSSTALHPDEFVEEVARRLRKKT